MNLEEVKYPKQEIDQIGEKLIAFLSKEDVDIGVGIVAMIKIIRSTLALTSPEAIHEFIKVTESMFAELKKEHPLKH